jgi:hypothetical protein
MKIHVGWKPYQTQTICRHAQTDQSIAYVRSARTLVVGTNPDLMRVPLTLMEKPRYVGLQHANAVALTVLQQGKRTWY